MSSSTRGFRWRRIAATAALTAALVGGMAATASADDYEPKRAAHPMRFVAYLVHPFGVLLDYLFVRPAHWLGHQEPFATVFGHEDY
ncbi:MAG: hypothetical protein QNK04_22825 [Myxococcota bacterium]|nr:hypothetical protein [Myxococcota bacterium]